MIPTAFDEENTVIQADRDGGPDDVTALSAHVGETVDGSPSITCCFKPTPAEWEEMRRTGRVWLVILGDTFPSMMLSGLNPFVRPDSSE